MSIPDFTIALQKAGLHFRTVSLTTVEALASIEKNPLPLIHSKHASSKSSDLPLAVAPLVRHGLVRLSDDRICYEITEKGAEYLTALQKADLYTSPYRA